MMQNVIQTAEKSNPRSIRDKMVVFRLKNEEMDSLLRLAEANGYPTVSEYIRNVLFGNKDKRIKKELKSTMEKIPETPWGQELKKDIQRIIDKI